MEFLHRKRHTPLLLNRYFSGMLLPIAQEGEEQGIKSCCISQTFSYRFFDRLTRSFIEASDCQKRNFYSLNQGSEREQKSSRSLVLAKIFQSSGAKIILRKFNFSGDLAFAVPPCWKYFEISKLVSWRKIYRDNNNHLINIYASWFHLGKFVIAVRPHYVVNIARDLLCIAKGEVLKDSWSRQIYSVDASHYEIKPAAVVCPTDEHDVQQLCEYSSSNKIPITARGAGTGLLGQSLSSGMILDFSKHMNKIIEIDDDYVTVQPGIVKGILDKELKKRNKFLPPDPASSNYCTIGGMIADNSSGIHCLAYGSTISFLREINVVYADGKLGFASPDKFDDKFKKLGQLLSPHAHEIKNCYPNVGKNSCGYRLDAVITNNFNPQKIFAASEGTLGVMTSAKLHILDIPAYRSLIVLGFEDLLCAISAVPEILRFCPVAVEMLDHSVMRSGDCNTSDAGCLLFIEFAGNGSSNKVEECTRACKQELAGRCSVVEYASDDRSITKIWMARKSALNSIMKLTLGSRKPIGLIEDTVVHPDLLAEHAAHLLQIYKENKLDYVIYGHVGDGNMHTRPLIDTASTKEVELIRNIANNVFAQVIKRGGTITGEHGDGLARTGYIQMMYGKRITSLFSQVKKLFDPLFTMNPCKKVPCNDLRTK